MAFVLPPQPQARPRDLRATETSTENPLYQDFRFKGYPSEGFFGPHNPQYKVNSAQMNGMESDRHFGKTQHFDPDDNARPSKINEDYRGQQYGSGDPRMEPSQQVKPSSPLRGLGFDNRSDTEREKFRREMIETDEDRHRIQMQNARGRLEREEEKKRQYEEILEQKRQDMEMLRNYNPWGRPGGGAPTNIKQKQKFTEYDTTPRDNNLQYKDSWEPAFPDIERIDFRREDFRNDFQKSKPGYEPPRPSDRTRLEQHGGSDFQRKQETLKEQEDRLNNLKHELDQLKAAASDRRPDSFNERQRNGFDDPYRRGNAWTAPETHRSVNPYEEYDNLGKIGKAKKPNMELHPIYHPFGKSGGGAPVKDDDGRINTVLHGHSGLSDSERRQNAIKAKIYHAELEKQFEYEQFRKQKEKEDKRKPFGELAVIFDDKLTGKPRRNPLTGELQNHHLPNSDVSLQRMGVPSRNQNEQRKYHNDLDTMKDEKNRRKKLGKLKDYQEGAQHYNTMDQLWGKPGGGAPKGYTMRKLNLNDIIDHPTRDRASDEYVRSKDWSEVEPEKFFAKEDDDFYEYKRSPRQNPLASSRDDQEGRFSPGYMPKKFVKSTVTSSHANQFDYRDDFPAKKDYRLGVPYATVQN